ncbi:MAG: ABC transporter ATP-binding protein [Gammaproteobacteria bacterium]|nr:ABC transporter ATP-binding protein [Gammaproteobacteria bacterium]
MASNIVIKAEQLTRRFGTLTAVDALNLEVPAQQIYGFLGPNGCGKTTAMRMLIGLLTPSAGNVTVLDKPLSGNLDWLRRKIGYMTQKFSLYDDLTVAENLNFIGKIYGFSPRESRARQSELLSIYHLQPQASQLAGSMSGGQRQRLALAAATFHRPELLLLDEPTSAVDPQSRRDFWEQLFNLCDNGTTLLVSTHYMDEAERCHRLAILENGKKRADDTPQTLMETIGVHVIEVAADNLAKLKPTLSALNQVISVTQQGARLRVLVDKSNNAPIPYLQQSLTTEAANQQSIDWHQVRPSLEDVFVMATGSHSAKREQS